LHRALTLCAFVILFSQLFAKEIIINPGVMMPESGRALSHTEAAEIVRVWILVMED
tara:strand:+ start:945 stop:1112 length:168 start_codon:yes stop_codon:yes gene_type:complete